VRWAARHRRSIEPCLDADAMAKGAKVGRHVKIVVHVTSRPAQSPAFSG